MRKYAKQRKMHPDIRREVFSMVIFYFEFQQAPFFIELQIKQMQRLQQ